MSLTSINSYNGAHLLSQVVCNETERGTRKEYKGSRRGVRRHLQGSVDGGGKGSIISTTNVGKGFIDSAKMLKLGLPLCVLSYSIVICPTTGGLVDTACLSGFLKYCFVLLMVSWILV